MSSPPRRLLRRARRASAYGVLVLLIALAVLVALANQLLPALEQHPREVAAWLSERVGQPLRFSAIEARWNRRGPRFALQGLEVGPVGRALAIGSAELQVSVYSGLFPGQPLTELSVDGLALTLRQDAEGRWRVEGLPQATSSADPLDVLSGFGELRVQGARLRLRAERWGIDHTMPRVDLRMRVDGERVRGGARLWSADGRTPLDLVAALRRDGSSGEAWLGMADADIAAWSPLLAGLGIEARTGRGRIAAWATLADRRVASVRVDTELAGVSLARIGAAQPPLRFDAAAFDARWSLRREGWQLEVADGRFQQRGTLQAIEDFRMVGGGPWQVEAARIDAAPLFALAALSQHLPGDLGAWLAEAAPAGTVNGLAATRVGDGAWSGRATLADVRFAAVGRRPGLDGLGGEVRVDGDGAVLALDGRELGLDWPSQFGPRLPLQVRGDLVFWRDPTQVGAWSIGSPDLAVEAPGLSLSARLQLGFQGDGSRPTLDLAARLADFDVIAAKRFWPQASMAPPVQRWLNEALQAGHARDGRVAIGGDLDDWPFRDGGGRFDGRVRLDDVTLKFNPDWPAATGLSGEAIFYGPGMALEYLAGDVQGTRVREAGGSIADFREPWLDLGLRGGGDAAALRRLLVASPLYAGQKATLDALSAEGKAEVDLRLRLPLKRELGERRVEGRLALDEAVIADRRWDLRFEDVTGDVPFTDRGFAVEDLAVRHAGAPARFALRVGDRVRDPAHGVELGLVARLPAKVLLDRSPDLAWLEPWMQGEARWDVGVVVPRVAADGRQPPARLSVTSDLVGLRLGLPAPLRKSEATPLALRLDLPLPSAGGDLQLSLGRLLRLRGRVPQPGAPFTAVAEFGSSASGTAMPAQGVDVRGQVPSLDVGGWVAAAAGGQAGQGALRTVDVQVGAIDVLDRSFGEGRVRLARDAEALRVEFDGAAIAGTVTVPVAEGSAVQGRFARLHWPAMDTKAMTGGAAAPAVDDTDPSSLPPLRFGIDDFRLGEAQLGRADLVTFPTPEGMHVDRFSTDSPALKLLASGDWTRIGGRTRSRFALDFDAGSLGQMLDALGFAGMVEQGPVKARMVGDWPGSPGSFRLDRYDGSLRLDVGKGRLLDVEPGTGRLLGLVSIAEIPRRLSLDFSDFFAKGFAFNALEGDFAFAGGAASTANLRIDGPSAEINVSGTTTLAQRQYDQRVEVLPKAGGVLPVIGAVTAGPAGAAIGAAAQAVFQSPLKQATRTVYSVQGPWAEPVVEVVERGPRRNAEAPAPRRAEGERSGATTP